MQVVHFIRRASLIVFALTAFAFLTGCDDINQMHDNAAKRPVVNMPPQVADAPDNVKDKPKGGPTEPAANQTVEIVSTQPAPPPAGNQPPLFTNTPVLTTPTMEKAGAGQGVQGSGYGGGIITEPVHQYFHARDRITFDIQIPKQMQIWKAMNNNRNPKNVAEYKKEILDPCGIELPELPPGKRYVYDAKKGELMVESGGPAQ